MAAGNGHIYEFGGFRLIPSEGLLLRDGQPLSLSIKAFSTLALLVERHGHLVSKAELLDEVWAGSFVEEGAIARSIWAIRNALGETPKSGRFIQTVSRRGYRFVAPVSVMSNLSGAYRLPSVSEDGASGSDDRFALDFSELDREGSAASSANGSVNKATIRPNESDAFTPSASYFSGTLIIAGCFGGIVVLAVLLAYFGFARTGSVNKPRSLAVLPVVPINSTEGNLLYEIGITESIINRLGSSEEFAVRSLRSVRDYHGQNVDPIAVGREQKVDYVLAPNYQISGERIKVSYQLFNVTSGAIEDSAQSLHDVSDVFAAQEAIAADFANRLMARFGAKHAGSGKQRGTHNEEAYRLYQQAMLLMDRRRPGNSEKAREHLQQAVVLDPNYAQAWGAIALAVRYSGRTDSERIHQELVEAASRALAIDPNVSDAYTALCEDKAVYYYDPVGAEALCRRAVQADEGSSMAHRALFWVLLDSGRHDEALTAIKRAIELDPLSYLNQREYGTFLYRMKRFDEAAAQWTHLMVLDPADVMPYQQIIKTFEAAGMEAEAFAWLIKLLIHRKREPKTIDRYKKIYETSGWRGVLLQRARDTPNAPAGGHCAIAALYARAGEKDLAFKHLEKSLQRREWKLSQLPESHEFHSLHDDPRFQAILNRMRSAAR
jgi:DNA-binding winged helix-turn-helix (wHTH) protein/TolB-like protein/Tfp pilus assembly protein PilF